MLVKGISCTRKKLAAGWEADAANTFHGGFELLDILTNNPSVGPVPLTLQEEYHVQGQIFLGDGCAKMMSPGGKFDLGVVG